MAFEDAADGGDHHARQHLQSGDMALIKGVRVGGEYFKDAEGVLEATERRDQDAADTKTAGGGDVHLRVGFGIVADKDFAGADAVGGNAGFGLQTDTQVGSSASGAGTADNLFAFAQRDGSAGGAGEDLGAVGDDTDGGFKIEIKR